MSRVIPATTLRHKATGVTISPYSVLPFGAPDDWERVESGFTVAHPDGTTGLGRMPFATAAEAQAWCDANPRFPGMSQG